LHVLHLATPLFTNTSAPDGLLTSDDEDAATDTFFSDTAAHDDGFFGHSVDNGSDLRGKRSPNFRYGMRSESQMPGTLEDLSSENMAFTASSPDNAKVLIGKRPRYSPLYMPSTTPVRASLITPKLCGTQDR
jgi:hypothetical protein